MNCHQPHASRLGCVGQEHARLAGCRNGISYHARSSEMGFFTLSLQNGSFLIRKRRFLRTRHPPSEAVKVLNESQLSWDNFQLLVSESPL